MIKRTIWTAFAIIFLFAIQPGASQAAPLAKFSWRTEYYNNASLSGNPVSVRFEDAVSHDWGTGSPGPDIGNDRFSARWSVTRHFEEGTYLFLLTVDDGARVWLNGNLIFDAWSLGHKSNLRTEIYIEGGDQQLQVAYFENTGNASINFEWIKLGGKDDIVGAWRGEYFLNRNLEGTPVLVRQEGSINYDWNSGSPDPRVTRDNFSVRWTNTLYLSGGDYTLRIQHDDGMRIFVDGNNVYNAWYDQGVSYQMRQINLTEGNHTFIVEYYDHLGNAVAYLKIEGNLNNSQMSDTSYKKMTYHQSYQKTPHQAAMVNYGYNNHYHSMSYNNNHQYDGSMTHDQSDPSDQYGAAANDYIIVGRTNDGIEQVTVIDNTSTDFRWGGDFNHRNAASGGHGTGFFWTYNSGTIPVDFGEWRPNLTAGQYEVFVYVPARHATTRKARYQIHHNNSQTDRMLDQSIHSNEWVSIGTYYFDGSGGEMVRLYDGTGEIYGSTYVAFDAVKFVRR